MTVSLVADRALRNEFPDAPRPRWLAAFSKLILRRGAAGRGPAAGSDEPLASESVQT